MIAQSIHYGGGWRTNDCSPSSATIVSSPSNTRDWLPMLHLSTYPLQPSRLAHATGQDQDAILLILVGFVPLLVSKKGTFRGIHSSAAKPSLPATTVTHHRRPPPPPMLFHVHGRNTYRGVRPTFGSVVRRTIIGSCCPKYAQR